MTVKEAKLQKYLHWNIATPERALQRRPSVERGLYYMGFRNRAIPLDLHVTRYAEELLRDIVEYERRFKSKGNIFFRV